MSKPSRGSLNFQIFTLALIGVSLLVGCGGGASESTAADDTSVAESAAVPNDSEEKMFSDSVGDEECRVLTTEDVAAATGVPADQIEQQAISGCLYSWSDGSIMLMSVRAHKTLKRAQNEYARFTKDASAEEVEGSKQAFQEEVAKKQEEGELTSVEGAVATTLTDAMPAEEVTHQRWSGIGSEASMNNSGSVRLRYGNVTVWFTGKTGDEDRMDPEIAQEIARRIVTNLDRME